MKKRYWFLLFLVGFYWGWHRQPLVKSQKIVTPPVKQIEAVTAQVEPLVEKLELLPLVEPDELMVKISNFNQDRLKNITLGWCDASLGEVMDQYLKVNYPSGTFEQLRSRRSGLSPKDICLNYQQDELNECFTNQIYCPRHFTEAQDVDLIEFFSSKEVFDYEQKVTNHRAFVQNPENPDYPDNTYWYRRAVEIQQLAEEVRGEVITSQNWAGIYLEN